MAVPDSNDVHCHAITSPGFKRAAATGKISTVPSTADLAALSAELGDDRTSQTSGSSEQVLLPKLESLLLKNCLVATEAIHSLLGVPAAGIHEGGSDALGGCHLTKLSITGDNSSHTEVVEGWSTWLQVIGHLRRLQVCTAHWWLLVFSSNNRLVDGLLPRDLVVVLMVNTSHA